MCLFNLAVPLICLHVPHLLGAFRRFTRHHIVANLPDDSDDARPGLLFINEIVNALATARVHLAVERELAVAVLEAVDYYEVADVGNIGDLWL